MGQLRILLVRKGESVVIAGDGQVSMGPTIIKNNARKVYRLRGGQVIAGFAGVTADVLTLFERLEAKLAIFHATSSCLCRAYKGLAYGPIPEASGANDCP